MGELQELIPSLATTTVFAICLVVIARSEEGYTWWKAALVPFAGALTGVLTELLIGVIDSPVLKTVVAIISLFAVIAVIAILAHRALLMSWRDGSLLGVGYVVVQAAVSFGLLYFEDHQF